jgi:hypothetical protein
MLYRPKTDRGITKKVPRKIHSVRNQTLESHIQGVQRRKMSVIS